MSKEYVMSHFEEDWDYTHIYFEVKEDGTLVKYDVETGNVIVSIGL